MWNSAQGTCTETGMDMKNTEEIYTDFARVYDELMDNTPYEEWGNRLDELIRKYGVSAPERWRKICWIQKRIWWWIWDVEPVRWQSFYTKKAMI